MTRSWPTETVTLCGGWGLDRNNCNLNLYGPNAGPLEPYQPLTVTQTAELRGVSRNRVLQLITSGRLPATKHGPVWSIVAADAVTVLPDPRRVK